MFRREHEASVDHPDVVEIDARITLMMRWYDELFVGALGLNALGRLEAAERRQLALELARQANT